MFKPLLLDTPSVPFQNTRFEPVFGHRAVTWHHFDIYIHNDDVASLLYVRRTNWVKSARKGSPIIREGPNWVLLKISQPPRLPLEQWRLTKAFIPTDFASTSMVASRINFGRRRHCFPCGGRSCALYAHQFSIPSKRLLSLKQYQVAALLEDSRQSLKVVSRID